MVDGAGTNRDGSPLPTFEISTVVHDGVVAMPSCLEGHRVHLTITDQGQLERAGGERAKRFGARAIPGFRIEPFTRDQVNQR